MVIAINYVSMVITEVRQIAFFVRSNEAEETVELRTYKTKITQLIGSTSIV